MRRRAGWRRFRTAACAIIAANRFLEILAIARRSNAALEARLLADERKAALRDLSKVPATAVRLFVCGDGYAGKTTLLSTLSSLCLHKPPQAPAKPRHIGYADIFVHLPSFMLNCWIYLITVMKTLLCSLVGLHKPQQGSSQSLERTRGIQVHTFERDGIQLSTWDLAGQPEFHAFHDHMIPDPSNSSAMFMFLWSPSDSKDESMGKTKTEDAFKDSFHYWLKFIAAKSPQSNILRKIIVVLTRQDQMTLTLQALQDSIKALKASFRDIFEVVQVFEVDARSPTSVQPLLSCTFETAKDVLEGVEIYGICAQVSEYLATEPTIKKLGPIMPWPSFSELCANRFNVIEPQIQKAIAYSLNESGCLIYLSNLPFLVLDPNWFCNVVMGSLIHFPHSPITSKGHIPIRGFTTPSYLEAILKEITQNRVDGHLLMDLLEAMHLFCRVPCDGDGKVFLPSTLFEITASETPLQWIRSSSESFAYAGRRLECDRKDLTFLTPGFFHMIQVLFNKAFLETRSGTVKLGKGFIFICKEDLQIIVEWGLAKGEHVIDVMVRAPNEGDIKGTLHDVENNIIKTLKRVCAQPVGNQGVVLVESVIRPHCLRDPAHKDVREDQCALMEDLKKELRRKLEEGKPCEKLLHVWPEGRSFDADSVYNHLIDLLGVEVYEKELQSYKESLEDASMMLQCTFKVGEDSSMDNVELENKPSTYGRTTSRGLFESGSTLTFVSVDHEGTATQVSVDGMTEEEDGEEEGGPVVVDQNSSLRTSDRQDKLEDDGAFEVTVTKQLARLISQKMQSVKSDVQIIKTSTESMHGKVNAMDGKLDSMDGKLDVIYGKLDGMHRSIMELRNDVLPMILKSVEQFVNFTIENERGRVPRYVFLTKEGVGLKGRMAGRLLPGVTSMRIELFCEHRGGPHRVEGQKGICVSTVNKGTFLKKALPYVQGFLKVLTLLFKVGAHVAVGFPGSSIPDFSKVIALVLDAPGFLDSQLHLLAKLDALAASGTTAGLPDTEMVLAKLGALCPEDFLGWEEWLVNELTRLKGLNHVYSGIAELFGLTYSRSKVDLKGAWLCDTHFKSASF